MYKIVFLVCLLTRYSKYIYQMKSNIAILLLTILGFFVSSCDNNIALKPADEIPIDLDSTELSGTGSFSFSGHIPLSDKPIDIFYHIPSNATSNTPILMVYHGSGRDGANSRNLLIDEADAFGFIVVVPEFSTQLFPGGDAFNLGNIFEDGDNPSATTLVAEEEWTFSLIDPLFDYFKSRVNSTVTQYDIFGFSGGAQFAHRHFIFNPNDKYNRVVAASSGWYTVLDSDIDFPYGTKLSPEENTNYTTLLGRPLTIIVGSMDNDPNSAGLRHNDFADAQGLHRVDRANHFYAESQKLARDLGGSSNWRIQILPNVAHDYEATSSAAAVLLYK
jgi:hypothetical protein